jgi:hypothetical protein
MTSLDEYLVPGIFLLGASVGWLLCHIHFRGLISACCRDLDTLSTECNGPDASRVIKLISRRHEHTDASTRYSSGICRSHLGALTEAGSQSWTKPRPI